MERKEETNVFTTTLYQDTIYDRFLTLPVSKFDIATMFKTDETISSAVRFVVQSAMKKIGTYTNSNKDIETFVQKNLSLVTDFYESLSKFVEDYVVYGVAVMEKVYKIQDEQILLSELVNVNPLALRYDDVSKQYEVLTVCKYPEEKIIVITNSNNPLGESILAKLFPIWQAKKMLMGLWINAMERFAVPLLKVKTTVPEKAISKLKNLWSEGIVAVDNNGEVDAIKIGNIADDFRKTIEYLNVQIYRSMLLPQLLLTTEFSGTYSVGKVHYQMFQDTLLNLAKKIVNALQTQLIKQLIDLNFSEVEDYGYFTIVNEDDIEAKKAYAEIVERLANAGFIDSLEDAKYVRSLFDIPNEEGTE